MHVIRWTATLGDYKQPPDKKPPEKKITGHKATVVGTPAPKKPEKKTPTQS